MEDSEFLWGDDRVEDNAKELAVIQMLAYKLGIYNPGQDASKCFPRDSLKNQREAVLFLTRELSPTAIKYNRLSYNYGIIMTRIV